MLLLQSMGFNPYVVNASGDVCYDMTNVTSGQVDAFERCARALFVQDDVLSRCGFDAANFNERYGGYHRQLLQYPIPPITLRIAEDAKVPWSYAEGRNLSNFLNVEATALRRRSRDDVTLRTITEANDYRAIYVTLSGAVQRSSFFEQMRAVHVADPRICSMERPIGRSSKSSYCINFCPIYFGSLENF